MSNKKSDIPYLQDIVTYSEKAIRFIENLTYEEFCEQESIVFAVLYALEVVGEAANKLSKEYIAAYPLVPFRLAIDVRNLIIHGYDQVKLDQVWAIVHDDLPPFAEQVQQLLQENM